MSAPATRLGLAAAVVAVWAAITIVVPEWLARGTASLQEMVTRDFAWGVAGAAAFLVVTVRLAGWRDVGFKVPGPRGWWRLLWLPVLYLAALGLLGVTTGNFTAAVALMVLANMTMVGFSEELAFRGVLWGAARRALPFWAGFVLVSAAFGLVHVLNALLTGELAAAGVQAMNAFMSGSVFLALRIRTRSILPVMVIHALWDFTVFLVGSGAAPNPAAPAAWQQQLTYGLMLTGPLFLYGLWLVRSEKSRAGWRDDATLHPAQPAGEN